MPYRRVPSPFVDCGQSHSLQCTMDLCSLWATGLTRCKGECAFLHINCWITNDASSSQSFSLMHQRSESTEPFAKAKNTSHDKIYIAPFGSVVLSFKFTCHELGPVTGELCLELLSPTRMSINPCADHKIHIIGIGLKPAFGQASMTPFEFEKEFQQLQDWISGTAEEFPKLTSNDIYGN